MLHVAISKTSIGFNLILSSETRENALLELSRKRESVESLAPMLWHSFGTISGIDFQKKTQ